MSSTNQAVKMAPAASEKVKLLLVDDSRENLLALEAALESLGQDLVMANSGIEALRYLLEDEFAAILLDVRMPDMDGFETASLIRSRKSSRNTPILFLTGYRNDEHLARGYRLGAVDFLFKPLVPEILRSKVAVFVDLRRNAEMLRRQAHDLQKAEKQFRAVLEAAPEAMIITDDRERISLLNSQTEKLFNIQRSELLGKPVNLILPEWSLFRIGETQETIGIASGGKEFHSEVSLSPLSTEEGGVTIGVIRDITERKQAQQNIQRMNTELERKVAERTEELMIDIAERKRAESALRESEQRLRVALEAANMGLWSLDAGTRRIRLSDRAQQILGLDSLETGLEGWKAILHPHDRAEAMQRLEGCLWSNADYDSEYRIATVSSDVRWIAARGRVSRDESDEPVRIVGILQDITERKLAEESFHHRQKLESLGVLAGGIAHDFNNLLTGILGNATLLLEDENRPQYDRESLNDLVSAAQRASKLTQQMLAYSGKGRFIIKEISLSNLIRDIIALVSASVPKLVEIRLNLASDLPVIDADESQIQQLIMNLVINACEAIGERGGQVDVITRVQGIEAGASGFSPGTEVAPGRHVLLEVSDNGHGMDEGTKARIFDPFFTTKFAGRGLGLAAALGIVRGHHGGIQVESEPGQGTTFRVYFPVAREMAAAPQISEQQLQTEKLEATGTILIVDDEPVVRNMARALLERLGFKVILAENGNRAWELFTRHHADISLVLLDMLMPASNGEEVFRKIREIRPDLPVLASSGYSEQEVVRRFGDGLNGFLQKPYGATDLARQVKEVMRTVAARRV